MWYKWRFNNIDLVFCPYFNEYVTIRKHNVSPIWIGPIKEENATEFWEKNWEGSGKTLAEVVDSGWPWNYYSKDEARSERYGANYGHNHVWSFIHNHKWYMVNQNGCLIDATLRKALNWNGRKAFVIKTNTKGDFNGKQA